MRGSELARQDGAGRSLVAAVVILIGLAGCGAPQGVAIDVLCPSAADMRARLYLRGAVVTPVVVKCAADDLVRAMPEAGAIGFDVAAGAWRVPPAALMGDDVEGVSGPAGQRLSRFLNHARRDGKVRGAGRGERRTVLAAHVARALATEAVGKYDVNPLLARLDARANGLDVYVADTVADVVALAGRDARAIVWLRDPARAEAVAVGPPPPVAGDCAALARWLKGKE